MDDGGPARPDPETPPEWLVTNGLGGYASGTVAGAITRRFHGFLVAALPAPLGRLMLLDYLTEEVRFADGSTAWLNARVLNGALGQAAGSPYLSRFRLDSGLPVWRYTLPGAVLERAVVMPHGQNTVHVIYRLLRGASPVGLTLRPLIAFRGHNAPLDEAAGRRYSVERRDQAIEIRASAGMPTLRLVVSDAAFADEAATVENVVYEAEARRGYDHIGSLASPGYFRAALRPDCTVALTASTEPWEAVRAVTAGEAERQERLRRDRLLGAADSAARGGAPGDLVLAADQFIIEPATRPGDAAGQGGRGRTVIAGYPWFTDWGRDTMISLEGLTLITGRREAARQILLTFSRHVRDGLIPNLFPEGENQGLYHTADATLWFVHAIARYEEWTHDRSLADGLVPLLQDIVSHHVAGTRFGIRTEADGLLMQGAPGYALTWMDAKVDDWVVTPRRGKAVEINALWYNALCLVEGWLARCGRQADAGHARALACRARASFNARFWSDTLGHLFDVVDGEHGDDPACRPNQLLALSLPHPVLDESRWAAVLDVVRTRLLTPRGLRSLAPGHPDYKPHYVGSLRDRDAAYHQGTVWSWLIGPYVDAWLAVHPGDRQGARGALGPMLEQLDEGCIGSVGEIFDGESPFTPRGCFAQAWGVAELLRALVRTEPLPTPVNEGRSDS